MAGGEETLGCEVSAGGGGGRWAERGRGDGTTLPSTSGLLYNTPDANMNPENQQRKDILKMDFKH